MRLACILTLAAVLTQAADPVEPKTGGPGKAPLSILVIGDSPAGDAEAWNFAGFDPQYAAELRGAGYRLAGAAYYQRLTAAYLDQYSVVILTCLPPVGYEYSVGGWRMAFFQDNLRLVQEYVTRGGGLIVEPRIGGGGDSLITRYNRFLEPFGVRYLVAQLFHKAEVQGAYAPGEFVKGHPTTAGLRSLLYPTNVLRWDDAYSATPFVGGPEWTVLATGKPGSGTHLAEGTQGVGDEQLTPDRNIFAMRQYGKGNVVLSAMACYYTLTHAYSDADRLGENNTGPLQGIVLKGEKDGRPSQVGVFLDRVYRHLGAGSARHGLGGPERPLPEQPPAADTEAVIDWSVAEPPPTWRHRVIPVEKDGRTYYDEKPDPAIRREPRYFKVLVGARTGLSSGQGTVREYRTAAEKSGYSAVVFTEPFEDMDEKRWDFLVRLCRDNSDETFVCVPGFDIEDFSGQRYLLISPSRYPLPTWLTADGKRLASVHWLSLGLWGHLAAVHRPGSGPIDPRMFKHYTGIVVATYDGEGKEADDGFHAWQWSVGSDSNPIPLAVHEVNSPEQVATAAGAGYQQIVPAQDIVEGMRYFSFALPHYFSCPLRYFISEAPVIDGWSIMNKDIGKAAENRDHWRLAVGARAEAPIREVTLYDGFEIVRRWRPNTPEFRTVVDGFHSVQHQFSLLVRDARGRRALSPGIRTVTRNWRCRCGDRQNWLGSLYIYTGTPPTLYGGYSMPLRDSREAGSSWWRREGGANPANVFSYPFFSNHVEIMEIDNSAKYYDAAWEGVVFDAKPTHPIRPSDYVDGHTRLTYFTPAKRQDFEVVMVENRIRLKRAVEPGPGLGVFPLVHNARGYNQTRNVSNIAVLPDAEPVTLGLVYDRGKKRYVSGDKANLALDLPVGTYAAGIVALSPGLRLHGRDIGFAPPPEGTLSLPAGSSWQCRFLVILDKRGQRYGSGAMDPDEHAVAALQQMGFRGETPYRFELERGQIRQLAYIVEAEAADGGIGGRLVNAQSAALLYHPPLNISGLNPRVDAAVWRSDSPHLDFFGAFEQRGYVFIDADKTVSFFAGNVAHCAPALFVSTVIWDAGTAWFRVHNPTRREVTCEFRTETGFRGRRQVKQSITVAPGTSIEVRAGQ